MYQWLYALFSKFSFREVQLKVADHNEKLKIMQRVNTGGKSKKTTAKTAATKGTVKIYFK